MIDGIDGNDRQMVDFSIVIAETVFIRISEAHSPKDNTKEKEFLKKLPREFSNEIPTKW